MNDSRDKAYYTNKYNNNKEDELLHETSTIVK